jgi:hypothetical protein
MDLLGLRQEAYWVASRFSNLGWDDSMRELAAAFGLEGLVEPFGHASWHGLEQFSSSWGSYFHRKCPHWRIEAWNRNHRLMVHHRLADLEMGLIWVKGVGLGIARVWSASPILEYNNEQIALPAVWMKEKPPALWEIVITAAVFWYADWR